MKIVSVLTAVTAFALFTGCANTNPKLTKELVKSAVTTGVAVGVAQEPSAIPYLRVAAPVVCEAAKGTNQSPQWVIDQLALNAQANALKNPTAVMIFNSAFGIYTGLYAQYGADGVEERATLKAWLEGTCEGILAGLPATTTNGVRAVKVVTQLPPHVKW